MSQHPHKARYSCIYHRRLLLRQVGGRSRRGSLLHGLAWGTQSQPGNPAPKWKTTALIGHPLTSTSTSCAHIHKQPFACMYHYMYTGINSQKLTRAVVKSCLEKFKQRGSGWSDGPAVTSTRCPCREVFGLSLGHLATLHSMFRVSGTLICPLWVPGMHGVHVHACQQFIHSC